MFHRIVHDHWTDIVPILGFVLTFAVFITALIRSLLMQKTRVQHLAMLPLEADTGEDAKKPSCKCDKSCRCCLKKGKAKPTS